MKSLHIAIIHHKLFYGVGKCTGLNEVICNIFGVVHMFKLEYVVCLELLEIDATELPGAPCLPSRGEERQGCCCSSELREGQKHWFDILQIHSTSSFALYLYL